MNKILSLQPLSPAKYPEYVELHLSVVHGTRELEAEANELIADHFPVNLLRQFITNVHVWGGHIDNLSMVLANAKPIYFESAVQALNASQPNIEIALISLMVIDGLGVSFGSKHLRFLCPSLCPILDSVIKSNLKYPVEETLDTKGYKLYQSDVMQVVDKLEENEIPNPMARPDGRWYAADVDMAIFAYLQRRGQKAGWM